MRYASVVLFCFCLTVVTTVLAADRELTEDSDPTVPPGVDLRSYAIEGASSAIDGGEYKIEGSSGAIEGRSDGIDGRATSLEGLAKDIEASGVKISENDSEIILELSSDVLFDFDKFNIKPGAAEALLKVAELLKRYPDQSISLAGHTDSKGTDSYNDRLSQRRAQSVKEFLVKQGSVPNKNLSTNGYGKRRPIVPNQKPDGSDDPEGRQRNRRVEIKIAK